MIDNINALFLPMASPILPKMMPPIGLVIKPNPKTRKEKSKLDNLDSQGKNTWARVGAR
jgi:hypothetical protein